MAVIELTKINPEVLERLKQCAVLEKSDVEHAALNCLERGLLEWEDTRRLLDEAAAFRAKFTPQPSEPDLVREAIDEVRNRGIAP